jgi:hypothetical protein
MEGPRRVRASFSTLRGTSSDAFGAFPAQYRHFPRAFRSRLPAAAPEINAIFRIGMSFGTPVA